METGYLCTAGTHTWTVVTKGCEDDITSGDMVRLPLDDIFEENENDSTPFFLKGATNLLGAMASDAGRHSMANRS